MRQHIFVQGKPVPSLGRFENQSGENYEKTYNFLAAWDIRSPSSSRLLPLQLTLILYMDTC